MLEAAGRLAFGVILVAAGLGVTGAYLGHAAVVPRHRARAVVDRPQRGSGSRRARPTRGACWDLVGGAWPAVIGLFLIAVLQNVDVIMVKRQIGGDEAGAYAAAAVAAKAVVWVAIGIGLYLLPEATRAARHGRGPAAGAGARAGASWRRSPCRCCSSTRSSPATVLRLAFGPDTVVAADALFVLGCAMTLLAVGYLGVQYMLALGRIAFLPALAAVAVAEIILLGGLGIDSLVTLRRHRAGAPGRRGAVRARDRAGPPRAAPGGDVLDSRAG